jgi:NAD(P) transhydrogenase subunit alpha
MVKSMKQGSVIVDMAVAAGGNCPLSKPDQIVTTDNGVQIVGYTNLPSRIAADASQLYAKNLYNFMALMIKDGVLDIPNEDQLIVETRMA